MSVINSGIRDLKDEIGEMSEDEKTDKIIKLAEEILKFNEQQQSGERL